MFLNSRAQFHRELAEEQKKCLDDLVASFQDPQPSAERFLELTRSFVRGYGNMIGSGPFLRGLRSWLDAQRGERRTVVWRVRAEIFTQSGGKQWMCDAVDLLMRGAVRRPDFDETGEGGRALWLAWCVTPETSDNDISEILRWIPGHNSLSDFNPTGEILVPDHGDGPLRARSSTEDERYNCCCLLFCGACFDRSLES